MLLKDKCAVVTGAGSGIGRAIAERFAAEGARVAALDINEDAVRNTIARFSGRADSTDPQNKGSDTAAAATHLALACNVADSASVDAAFKKIKTAFGKVDVLVNNAGIGRAPNDGSNEMYASIAQRGEQLARGETPTAHPDQLIHMSDAGWAGVMGVNIDGVFYCTRAAVRIMAELKTAGSIISIASTSAQSGQGPLHYVTSKAAVVGFTRGLAGELGSRRIRVNAVAPGATDTPIMQNVPDEMVRAMEASSPLGRMGQPREMAAVVTFLASDEASYVTGSLLTANGGMYFI